MSRSCARWVRPAGRGRCRRSHDRLPLLADPEGWKVAILLEEAGLDHRMIPVNVGRGEQHAPEFLAISPNGRTPAIVDHDAAG